MYWIAFLVPFIMVIAGLILSVARRRAVAAITVGAEVRGAAELGRRRSSRRLRLSLLLVPTVAGVIVAGIIAAYGPADGVGGPLGRTTILMITPLLAAIITVLGLAFVPRYVETTSRRSADAVPRSPLTFSSRAALIALLTLAILLVAATVVFGVLAWPHGESLFYFYGDSYAGGGGEFPGFGFGVPMLVNLALLVAALWLSLSRIAGTPRPTDEGLRAADTAVRTVTATAATAMASFAVALSLGIVLLMASIAFWDVAGGNQVDAGGNPVPVNATAQLLSMLSHAGVGLGVGMLIVAIYFLVHAVSCATGSAYRVTTSEAVNA
jgi:hypothetical protein